MILKDYQAETLRVLRAYLETCRMAGPAEAYGDITGTPEQKARLGRYAQDYRALEGLPDVPYVCLRLPTGGGKTILAAHSIAVARDAWIERDYPAVLWLTPTKTIRLQTAEALKNPAHPYRRALDDAFDGRVRVFDIADFTHIRPQDVRDSLCVIVGTIQTLRVDKTEGRKVYAHHEDMEPHFSAMARPPAGLERVGGGEQVKFSFANLLHTLRPVMIVDEAHKAVTELSREMQQRVNPGCIIEFTATPRLNSNILHSVTAQEIKDEEMIKLPVVLAEHPDWQAAVDGAVQRRRELAAVAEKHGEAIRPLVLFQAQKKNEDVTVDVLKDYLVNTSGIDDSRIAVATGEQRELDAIDLLDPACPVEFVITIEALKEGWDCPFAYVFCSVSRIRSASAVEQLLGRVLRMPFAKRRRAAALNRAYAHVSEPEFFEAATALKDKLVAMGFDEQEAALNIERERREGEDPFPTDGVFGRGGRPEPSFSVTVPAPPDISGLSEADRLAFDIAESGSGESGGEESGSGGATITISGPVSDAAFEIIAAAVPEAERRALAEKVSEHRRRVEEELSPAARRVPFSVPRLMCVIEGQPEQADPEVFDEFHDWSLADYPARLEADAFTIRDEARMFEIDLDGRTLSISSASDDRQLSMDALNTADAADAQAVTEDKLALALDRLIADPRFSQSERLEWCLAHVRYLRTERGIAMNALWRARFVLGRKLGELINRMKAAEAKKACERFLFASDARPEVSLDEPFRFHHGMYDGQKPYRGKFRFKKHYLDIVPDIDGGDTGEEMNCARALEALPAVKHWLRNVPRHPASFRLPMADGWTYPDFVAELDDGRRLVVEYKGADRYSADHARAARRVGELWERHTGGQGLYIMAVRDDNGKDVAAQLADKIRQGQP